MRNYGTVDDGVRHNQRPRVSSSVSIMSALRIGLVAAMASAALITMVAIARGSGQRNSVLMNRKSLVVPLPPSGDNIAPYFELDGLSNESEKGSVFPPSDADVLPFKVEVQISTHFRIQLFLIMCQIRRPKTF